MQPKKRALGRGLGALLPPKPVTMVPVAAPAAPAETPAAADPAPEVTTRLPIDSLSPNAYQPRDYFDDEALKSLADSIRERGIIQPIAVTKRGEQHMIIAGERRWRAARMAGLSEVPVIVLEVTEQQALELAMIENLQRENLNPMEEARGYKALIDNFGLSQEEIAEHLGKGRPTISNALRLLKLPADIQREIEMGKISAGHARAILSLELEAHQQRLRHAILRDELSVREAEHLAFEIANRKPRKQKAVLDPNVQRLRELLIERLACRVDVKTFDQNKGKIEIFYNSLDELERILAALEIEVS